MAKQEFPPLLPAGFHPMTIPEMRAALVTAFKGSKRRAMVLDGLEKVFQTLVSKNIQAQLWIDGSFLTKKIDPDDSDILVLVQGDFYDKASAEQTQFHCHSFLHFIRPAGHPEYDESSWDYAYWLRQFGFSRKDERKGIITINIP